MIQAPPRQAGPVSHTVMFGQGAEVSECPLWGWGEWAGSRKGEVSTERGVVCLCKIVSVPLQRGTVTSVILTSTTDMYSYLS